MFFGTPTSIKSSHHDFWSAKGRTSMKICQSTDLELLCVSARVCPWIARLNFDNKFVFSIVLRILRRRARASCPSDNISTNHLGGAAPSDLLMWHWIFLPTCWRENRVKSYFLFYVPSWLKNAIFKVKIAKNSVILKLWLEIAHKMKQAARAVP